jgi:AraC-like DNA-binding protein
MRLQQARSGGEGLERSCREPGGGWIASTRPVEGVELFRAWLRDEAYDKHRHDTYAIGLTDAGVQVFDYRGAGRASLPGQVVVLHPDEVHDGRAGTAEGFGYRIVYVEPARLGEAARAVRGRPGPLPFVREPVSRNARLAGAVRDAFAAPLDSLAADALVVELAEGVVAAGQDGAPAADGRRVDASAVERAREFLDAERTRVVRSAELEAITGLTRYDLARQFRIQYGTSPHRYLLMRRLDAARATLQGGHRLADVAADTGFADQAHFTRVFKAAVGLTPARYRALSRSYTTSSVRAVVSPKRPRAKAGRPA